MSSTQTGDVEIVSSPNAVLGFRRSTGELVWWDHVPVPFDDGCGGQADGQRVGVDC